VQVYCDRPKKKIMAPQRYTIANYIEMLVLYFRNGENQREAAKLFGLAHQNRPDPAKGVVGRLIRRFDETDLAQFPQKPIGRKRVDSHHHLHVTPAQILFCMGGCDAVLRFCERIS
jgi:hypothetical protein